MFVRGHFCMACFYQILVKMMEVCVNDPQNSKLVLSYRNYSLFHRKKMDWTGLEKLRILFVL